MGFQEDLIELILSPFEMRFFCFSALLSEGLKRILGTAEKYIFRD